LTETLDLLQKFQLDLWEPEKLPDNNNAISDEATTATEMTEDTADDDSAPSNAGSMKIDEIEDDPLTRMKVHKVISVAIEAYMMTISHPLMARSASKTACEQALACIEQLVIREYFGGRAGGRDDNSASGSAAVAARARNQTGGDMSEASQLHRLLESLNDCSNSVLKIPAIHSHISRCVRAILTSPRCGIHESSMLFGIRIVFHSYLVSPAENCRKSAKEALLDIVEYYMQRLELDGARGPASLWYTDCFYMMRSFIKLSSKEIQGVDENTSTVSIQKPPSFFQTAPTADPVALHNKILSLELQRRAIECSGPVFCNGEKFIQLIQSQNGSIALFKNCMSQCTQVAFISQQVFLIMCYKFKHHIKDEMQAFMSNIFFRVLESENSNSTQKALVLESLRSLCKDPFLLSQIFLNYDCDMDSESLYKDIVFHLAQLCARSTIASATAEAKGGRSNQKQADENAELSLAGCEVMVTILRSFLEALNIPTNDDEEEIIDTAGKKIRSNLTIEDIVASVKRRSSTFSTYRQTRKNADIVKSSLLGGANPEVGTNEDEKSAEDDDDLAGTILGSYEKKKNAEQNLELGVVKFTMDLKKGLRFFIDNEFVTCDANEIAHFFLVNKDRLDKTQMGEALGREPDSAFIKGQPDLDPDKGGPGFFCRILHHYANALDFTEMFFAEAIRLFLSGFRLPGEAQKIDRIMEKFAEHFTAQNPDVFPNADTAFILAFSVIMLNTDLHNPSIKPERRMTIESFIRNNRGIGENGADLDPVFLTKIFDRIKVKPFSLKEDDAAREKAQTDAGSTLLGDNGGLLGAGLFGTTAEEKKKEKFKKEQEDMVSATEMLIRRKKGKTTKAENLTDAVDPAHVVKPMFDVTWGAIIGTLSQVMECSNDEQSLSVCLTGFIYAIRISAHSNMSLARDTFLGSLAKFTYLGSIKELKYKNVEIIRSLINIAVSDGEYLGESWGKVLQCISQLARMRMSASGLDNDEAFLQDSTHSGTSSSAKIDAAAVNRSMFARDTKADVLKETQSTNSRIVLNAISEQLIDQVFSSSVKLSAQSLALFIEQLITVANSEIDGDSQSGITGVSSAGSNHGEAGLSIFSMQRLVEVADYNMHARPPLVWVQIWGQMSTFFSKNGCHKNSMVSVFAVDALKQLSLKFLEKPEASEFHFQRLFLEPFLVIMKNKDSIGETREIVLACVDQMIHSRIGNLKSGWRVFFDIIKVGATDSNKKVSLHSLSILQGILDKHLGQLSFAKEGDGPESDDASRDADAEDFLSMCKASLSFIDCPSKSSPQPIGISMRALSHIAIYADLIASKKVLPPISGAQSDDADMPGYTYESLGKGYEALEMVLWRPLLEGLARGAKSATKNRADGIGNFVQRSSVLALRAILLRHGASLTANQLKVALSDTILPAFQEALECDNSPVVSIASESPSISSLDFLAEPFPLPPLSDDEGLLKFEQVCQQSDRNPREMGPAELLLEATFTVMRNGGGGDLSEAYKFAKKDIESKEDVEQPFPDSWISTTAPIALGALTDLSSEILFTRGAEGASVWRSTVGATYLRCCNGDMTSWVPCEAVVRIASSELSRFMKRVTRSISTVAEKEDANAWANKLIEFYTEVMGRNLGIAKDILDMLLESKCPEGQNNIEAALSSPSPPTSPKVMPSMPSSPPKTEPNATSPQIEDIATSPPSSSSEVLVSNSDGMPSPPSSPLKREANESPNEVANEFEPSLASEGSGENKESLGSDEQSEDGSSSSSEESHDDESSSSASEILTENWVSVESSQDNEATSDITEHTETRHDSDSELESESETSDDSSEKTVESLTPAQSKDIDDINEIKKAMGIAKVDIHTLYPSKAADADRLPIETFAKLDERYNTPDSPHWMKLLPALKLRCVAAHYLQKILLSLREEELIGFVSHETVSNLLKILNASRDFAEDAAKNEDLAHAFQEAMLREWGISDDMGEEAMENIARLNHTQGSAMFFLTQTAGATNGVNRLLTALYDHEETFHGEDQWDRRVFAGQYLVAIMEDIFRKFTESEAKEGHKVDPNVWRNSSESGVKIAIYCTSFASVVVGLLRAMLSFEPALIERNKGVFYPLVCELVGVRSEEIRKLVRRVLTEKFGPMLGLGQDYGAMKPMRLSLDGGTDHGI